MMYDILQKQGAKSKKLTLYTNEEMEAFGVHDVYHASGTPAYQDIEMMDWIYAQSK